MQLALAQHLAETLAGRRLIGLAGLAEGPRRRQQRIEHALFRGIGRLLAHLRHRLVARHLQRDLDEIAHDRLDVAPDVADLGELRRLDLDERRAGELGEAARDLGLADAGRADHQDVLRHDLVAQTVRHVAAAPARAQRDRDGALGGVLADDMLVELVDDFLRRQRHELLFAGGHGLSF